MGGVRNPGRGAETTGRATIATPGAALRRHPLRLLVTSWPWRSLAYLAMTPAVSMMWALTCWPLLALAGLPLGHVERWRLRWVDLRPVPNPHTSDASTGFAAWTRQRARDRATWTELLHGVVLVPLSLLIFALLSVVLLAPAATIATSIALFVILVLGIDPTAVTTVSDLPGSTVTENPLAQLSFAALGAVIMILGLHLVTLAAEGQRHLTRLLISEPDNDHTERLHDLTRSRARITTAFDDERRRIERDLHDGVQQRLTSVVMTLGALRYQHDRGADIIPLIDQARADAQHAIDELRDVVHGIYPAALREHDLADALDELAARAEAAGLRASVHIDLPDDLPDEVAVGIYFAASELFTNVAKHAQATAVLLLAQHKPDGTTYVTVEDDGRGGARPDGTGLLGIIDRIETLGGQVAIASPIGGPTRITLEVPCAS
ncbi:histidine kinase [Micromonospora rosaria]|uniref:histidine kinase n=2 Tax=Micromonospora rosaria TaxID=47874 RepID=A0A136PP02_9ACTN|nr:histidine kinase [Micromonospora rosaria]